MDINERDRVIRFFDNAPCDKTSSYLSVLVNMRHEIHIDKRNTLDILESLLKEAFHIIRQNAHNVRAKSVHGGILMGKEPINIPLSEIALS